MKLTYPVLYIFVCILLFILIVQLATIYFRQKSREGFDTTAYQLFRDGDTNTPLTNHNVDMPINTSYSCQNICGPQSQCSITREQCTSDVDCMGCQPLFIQSSKQKIANVRGQNDAGKLTYNQTPTYSVLTTDIGTQAALFGKKLAPVPIVYEGVDAWMESANYGMELIDNQVEYIYHQDPNKFKYMPHYSPRESATGLFVDNGPLAANAYW